jgi:hypothetical protein
MKPKVSRPGMFFASERATLPPRKASEGQAQESRMRIFGKNRREYPTGPPRPYSATLIDWIWLTSWQKAMALRQGLIALS